MIAIAAFAIVELTEGASAKKSVIFPTVGVRGTYKY